VEFSPEDATRTELEYLLEVVQTAVDAGATYINIPDTVGFTTPQHYGEIFRYLTTNIKSDREIIFSPHCHNYLGIPFQLLKTVPVVLRELSTVSVSEQEMRPLKK
jgi:2-isopropylmalate synthase